MLGGTGSGSSPTAHSASILDGLVFDELRESLEAQPGALVNVYRKFLQTARTAIDGLRDQDGPARMSTVHTLKGSAAMLGANRLSARAAQLQTSSHDLDDRSIEEAIRNLSDELDAFQHSVNARFALLGQPQP